MTFELAGAALARTLGAAAAAFPAVTAGAARTKATLNHFRPVILVPPLALAALSHGCAMNA